MAILGAAQTSQVERFLAIDEQSTLLRVTWRSAHGFLNLSLWRDGCCVETFHLSPREAGRLVAFVATTLTAALPDPGGAPLRLVDGEAGSNLERSRPAILDRMWRASLRLTHRAGRRPR